MSNINDLLSAEEKRQRFYDLLRLINPYGDIELRITTSKPSWAVFQVALLIDGETVYDGKGLDLFDVANQVMFEYIRGVTSGGEQ